MGEKLLNEVARAAREKGVDPETFRMGAVWMMNKIEGIGEVLKRRDQECVTDRDKKKRSIMIAMENVLEKKFSKEWADIWQGRKQDIVDLRFIVLRIYANKMDLWKMMEYNPTRMAMIIEEDFGNVRDRCTIHYCLSVGEDRRRLDPDFRQKYNQFVQSVDIELYQMSLT